MNIQDAVSLGKTRVQVSRLGLGSAALGFLYEEVETQQAMDTISFAVEQGVRLFDTAALYGAGLAERRFGMVLPNIQRDKLTVATKIGYDFNPDGSSNMIHDFSYDAVLRQFENSLARLGLDRVDILHIHDCDDFYDEALQGAYKALRRLKDEGAIKAIGAGMNQSAMLTRFAKEGEFDCFLLAGRYTLLDQSAMDDLMPIAVEKGISILVGGPLNSGILADPYGPNPMFNYGPAPGKWVEKARSLADVCQEFDVPLKAAALQFPLAHPAVASVVSGARSIQELEENMKMLRHPIPAGLWEQLKSQQLIPDAVPVPAQ